MQKEVRALTSVDLRVVTNDKQDFLGSTGQTGDGRVFRYCQVNNNYIFTVTSANATIGATYTNNGNTFTVNATISSGTTLYMTATGAPSTSGTLTKASGTGDSTITFSAVTGGVTAGVVLSSPNTPATWLGLSALATTGTVGQGIYTVQVKLGSDAVLANALQDGELDVITGAGKGTSYRITGNSAASANGTTTIQLASPLTQPIAANDKVNLSYNLWYGLSPQVGLAQSGSNTNYRNAGVTTNAMGINQYGWIQVTGRALVQNDGSAACYKGFNLVLSKSAGGNLPGAVVTANASSDADKQIIGFAIESESTGVTGTLFPAYIQIT